METMDNRTPNDSFLIIVHENSNERIIGMINSEDCRNFVIAGHAGCGKTTLCDLMLFKSKEVDRMGSISQKTSVSDFTPEEQQREASLFAAVMHCKWQQSRFFFIDTPGYGEFVGEMLSSMRAADSVLVMLDGTDGPQVGTARAWKFTKLRGVPRFAAINRLDRERADFDTVLAAMRENHGKNVVLPLTYPVGNGDKFTRVIDVLHDTDIPSDIAAQVAENKEMLMDAIAETNDSLMERYLNGDEIDMKEFDAGLLEAVLSCRIIPVFATSSTKDIGVTELMNYIERIFPKPLDKKQAPLANGEFIKVSDSGAGIGLIFKAVDDPYSGHMAFMKVISGSFKSDSDIFNVSTNTKERIGQLLLVNGKNTSPINEVGPGTLCAITKLKNTHIGNTISSSDSTPIIKGIDYNTPVMSYAIKATKSSDDDKLNNALHKIAECDPTIKVFRDDESHQLLISGMGDQHLNLAIKRIKELYKVDTEIETPKIAYRETITGKGDAMYRHKKQTGGAGQFAEVHLRIEFNPDGFEFCNAVVGGNIPKNFIPAVEKGVSEMLSKGPLVGCKVENVKVTVYDGKYHSVDSNEMAFKIASRMAFKDAMSKASPIILEPIMLVKIYIPSEYMGDITGDLNHKRGRILGMDVEEGMQVVNAEVPLAELGKYATELRSMTQGRGSFQIELARYEQLPTNLANELIKQHQSTLKEDE